MPGNWNSGRRPAPTAMKVLRGTGKPRPNEPHPQAADASFDSPPPEVADDPLAAKEWGRVAPILRACGLVSEADRTALVACCQQWSQYLDAQKQVRKLGMIVKRPDGVPVTNPYIHVADRSLKACHRLWSELGLTPGSRAKMTALPGDSPRGLSKWEGLL